MIEIRKIEEVRRGVDIPEITGIYDPLSGKKDGTITPMAPLVVWGRNLRHYALEDFKLCLVAQRKPVEVIEIKLVYTYYKCHQLLLYIHFVHAYYFATESHKDI